MDHWQWTLNLNVWIVVVFVSSVVSEITGGVERVKYSYFTYLLITHLKVKIAQRSKKRTRKMFIPLSSTIGQFTLIFKLTTLNRDCWTYISVCYELVRMRQHMWLQLPLNYKVTLSVFPLMGAYSRSHSRP